MGSINVQYLKNPQHPTGFKDSDKKRRKIMNSGIPLQGLLSIVSRNHYIFINKKSKTLGLTGRQFPCLILLSHKPGITQDDIAKTFQIDKGSVARSVKKLEDDEFIHRIPDPKNRRKYLLFLTKKGEKVIPKVRAIEEEWEKMVCEGLEESEKVKLREFVTLLAKNSIDKLKKQN